MEEGRWTIERYGFSYRSVLLRPSSVRAAPCQLPPWGKLSFCLVYGKARRRIQNRNAVIDKDRNVMCTINKTNIENIYKNTY